MVSQKVTFCRICEASCGMIAELDGERVLQLRPDTDHVVSRGYACIKGVRYGQIHHSRDRVLTPLKRSGTSWEAISWPQALREIGDKLRALREAHGPDSAGLYIGNPATFSPAHLTFADHYARALGTRHVYSSHSNDYNNKYVVSEEMFGAPTLQPIPDLDFARFVMMLGSNPGVSQLSLAHVPRVIERLRDVQSGGGRVVFVNPRRTESAQQVGEHLFIRPGTDVFFILAFAHVVLAGRAMQRRAAKRVDGYTRLLELVTPWTPERVERVTGVAARTVRSLAAAYLAAEGAVLYAGSGINQGPHGTLCVWLLNAISIISGNIDRPGGMLVTRQMMQVVKQRDHGAAIRRVKSRISEHRSVLATLPAGLLADEILTAGKGKLRALFVTAGNPLLSCGNSARMSEALRELKLLVSIDLFRNETGNLAHYILPATTFLERSDVPLGMAGYQPVPYLQYVEPVVAPRGESRPEWWIFAELARVTGTPLVSRAFQAWLNASCRERPLLPSRLRFKPERLFALHAALERMPLARLRKHPHGLLLPPLRTGKFLARGVFTANHKVQLAPAVFVEAAAALERDHGREWAALSAAPPLRLIGKRELTTHNSWMHNIEAFVAIPRHTNYVYMHPVDAARRGLRERDVCRVRSVIGQIELPLKLTDELMPGTVAVPFGWGHQDADGLSVASKTRGKNVNLLSPDGPASLEALAGMTRLTAIEVQVEASSSDG